MLCEKDIVKTTASDYKIFYYLSNLWLGHNKLYVPIKDNINIIQNKVLSNNLLNDYIKLLPLLKHDIVLDKFYKIMKENLELLRIFGLTKNYCYHLNEESTKLKFEGTDNENINIVIKNITDKDITDVFNYRKLTNIEKKYNIKQFSNCNVVPKYKSGDIDEPKNFRYVMVHHNVIKIIDRLWCIELLHKCGNNLPDNNIFKSYLINPNFSEISNQAIANTEDLNNKVIIDIKKAFDSMEWYIVYKLLLINLTRKINKTEAEKFVEQYFIILKNRNIYYKDKLIKVSKGLPVGLPSSTIVFQFVFEEIILRWLYHNKNFVNQFKINIFVDDTLFDFLSNNNINFIIISFIDFIKPYGLDINKNKFKISPNIYNGNVGTLLTDSDFYLGIPFTRDIQLYGFLVLKSFQEKYNNTITWTGIYKYIEKNNKISNSILGFFIFKLKLLIKNRTVNKTTILNFIKEHYIIR
jgi:hypothetical protein